MNKIYCLDFDGVLCNSIAESFLTSYNAYFGKDLKDLSEIDPLLKDFFFRHRFLVRPAGEFYLLFHTFQDGERVIEAGRFRQLKTAFRKEMEEHARTFYACRKRLQQASMDHWLNLHEIYPQCLDFLRKRTHPFFVVTNKDRDSVLALSRYYGFRERIIEIYSKEIAIKKKILFERLLKNHTVDPSTERVIFVDDHAGTLGELAQLPLELYLAAWGYTGEEESGAFRLIHNLNELP